MLGPSEEEFQATRNAPDDPEKVDIGGITVFLLETEKPLFLSDWAADLSLKASARAAAKAKAQEAKL